MLDHSGRFLGSWLVGLVAAGVLAAAYVLIADPSLLVAIDAAEGGVGAVATVAPVVIGLNLAVVLISIAAVRAGWARWWLIVLAVLALVADMSPTNWNTVLHSVFATIVFGVIAARLAGRLDSV